MKTKHCMAIVYENGDVFADSTVKSAPNYTCIARHGEKFKVVRVKIAEHTKRSLDASALFHVWCQQLSGFIGEDPSTVKQMLKIKFGYPLLKQNDDIWPRLRLLFRGCHWVRLPWPKKLLMAEIIPCTSLMTNSEMKQFMDNIKNWAISEHNLTLDNGKRE